MSEFPGTIAAYSRPLDDNSVNRIIDRYAGVNPLATGSIVLLDQAAIGLAYSGITEYQRKQDAQPVAGINVSSWISKPFRGQSFGNRAISHALHTAIEQTANPNAQSWHNKAIWTSIKLGNLASIRACENVGFVNTGLMLSDPGRSIYLFG